MRFLRSTYRRIVPRFLRNCILWFRQELGLFAEYARDWSRYRTHSAFLRTEGDMQSLVSEIMIDYHRIEKGFALQNPRPGFGRSVTLRLISNLDSYLEAAKPDWVIHDALSSLKAYINIQQENGMLATEVADAYKALVERHKLESGKFHPSATVAVTRREILEAVNIDYEKFVIQRHSIRNFTVQPIEPSLLVKSVDLARHAPSVCNRQAWHSHIVTDPAQIERVLQIQRGALSFKDCVQALMVVTTNQKRFVGAGERNQQWVDGGIFLMSLTMALHAMGLGACCLNWCGGRHADRALQRELKLPAHQSIIAAIAIGHLPEKLEVAKASKLRAEDIIVLH